MKKLLIIGILTVAIFSIFHNNLFAQGGVGIGTTSPDASSSLEISSNSKGVLIPRITLLQRNTIANPANSLVIYQTDGIVGFYTNSGTPSNPIWVQLLPNPANTDLNLNNNKITNMVAPSNSSDATNKGYVDNLVAGLGNKGVPTMISNESFSAMNIGNAFLYCDTLTEGGFKDWYLPSIENMLYSVGGGTNLPDARTANYLWTLTLNAYSSNFYYYIISINDGNVSWTSAAGSYKCRCIR